MRKNPKYIKITEKANIKIQKNKKNSSCAKTQKYRKTDSKKRNKSKVNSDIILKSTIPEPNRNMRQPELLI